MNANHNKGEKIYACPNIEGWKSLKVYYTGQKGLSLYCIPFLPYILILIKNNESNVVKIFKRTIF
jgi:hypothetical protein